MTSLQVLIVDDEPAVRQVLAAHIGRGGHIVDQAESGAAAFERLGRGDVDVALCDINMPGMSGIELLQKARAASLDTVFIMITAYASVDNAIEAMKAGATDYLIKPVRHEEVLHRLAQVGDVRRLRDQNRLLRRVIQGGLKGQCPLSSPAMCDIERLVAKVAPTDSTVLITGESGTGKSTVARAIHERSARAAAPFVSVNCGAIPETLLESELFGHLKGAFTGADKARKGLFLEADKGTILLDEIGELPQALQVKLLHVLENREIRPLGSDQSRRADVRIVAATNRDIKQMLAEGKFREDLYFRLSVMHIDIPPLRQRREDIRQLIHHFLELGAKRLGMDRGVSIDPVAEEILCEYDWPGNAREIENVIERALILADGDQVSISDLPPQITKVAPSMSSDPAGARTLRARVQDFEMMVISRAIEEAANDRQAAAHTLGIGLSTLYRKLDEYAKSNPNKTDVLPGGGGIYER